MKVCREALSGGLPEMIPDGKGDHRCKACGASRAVVTATLEAVQADWGRGGPGFREAPRTFLGSLWSRLFTRDLAVIKGN